jgi:hypothetical protein
MAAEMAEGDFRIRSQKGEGTELTATFRRSHMDRMPVGDMAGTLAALVQGAPDVDYIYKRTTDCGSFTFDTALIRKELEGVPLGEPAVLNWIREYIVSGEAEVMAENM